MPAVTRVGDNNTGHDACPPTALSSGSPNVNINGIPAGRVGDPYNPHGCLVHVPHIGNIAAGAPHVFINGKAAGRIGDPVSCGGSVAVGSPNVNIGNGGGGSLTVNGHSVSALDFKCKCVGDVISCSPLCTKIDEIILALPDIANNVSVSFEEDNDQQGWLYLANMAKKWLTGKSEIVTSKTPIARKDQIFDISWDWGNTYAKIQNGIASFLSESDPDAEYRIFNKASQASLIQILKENNLLYSGATFDFINTDKINFKKNCFAYYPISREFPKDDGLQASLAGCSIRSLAKGHVIEDLKGLHIIVEEIGLFIFDIFQFEESEYFSFIVDNLGFWSKEKLDFQFIGGDSYYNLGNSDFNSFRDRFKRGQDFFVISDEYKIKLFSERKIDVN